MPRGVTDLSKEKIEVGMLRLKHATERRIAGKGLS